MIDEGEFHDEKQRPGGLSNPVSRSRWACPAGCFFALVYFYFVTMCLGALFCCVLVFVIPDDTGGGSPGGLLIVLALASVVGGCGGFVLAGVGHIGILILNRMMIPKK